MTLAKLKASPFGTHDKLTSIEIEILNEEIPFAIDGRHGGTYTIDAPLIINGSFSISFGANFSVIGSMLVTSASTFIGQAEFDGGALFSGTTQTYAVQTSCTLDIQSGANVIVRSGGTFSTIAGSTFIVASATAGFTAAVAIGGTLTAAGAAFSSTVTFAGTVSIGGSTAIFGISTATTFNNAITLSQIAHIVSRVETLATPPGSFLDSNTNISVGTQGSGIRTADIFQPGTLTANRTWTVVSTGIADGSTLEVSVIDCPIGFNVSLHREDSSTIIGLARSAVAGTLVMAVKLVKISGVWQVHSFTHN